MIKSGNASPHIGHVHLKVADLERSIAFYRDIIGLEVMNRMGDRAAFLGADGYHHHIGLNTWHSKGGTPAPRGHTGLFHTAFLYPDLPAVARVLRRALDAGVTIEGASDHGVSRAIYFSDPDGNGIEVYVDRDEADWPRDANGELMLPTQPLDLQALLHEYAPEAIA